jgi:hypothetical protein
MISATEIKSTALGLGADRCGFASTDRFDGAPAGFHPCDIYKKCREYSSLDHPRGWSIYTCSKCRLACPYMTGKLNT